MTDLSGVQQAVQKIAEQTVKDQGQGQSGGLDKGSANTADVQKLQAALNQPPPEATATDGTVQAEATEKVAGVQPSGESTPGAKVLENMNNVRTGFQEAIRELQDTLANGASSPADMLKVQLKLQQVTLQQDLMGKVVSKSEQNVDQLLKGQ